MQRATSFIATTSTFAAAACAIAILIVGSGSSLAAGDPEAGRQVFARCGTFGVPNSADRQNVIAYLAILKGH